LSTNQWKLLIILFVEAKFAACTPESTNGFIVRRVFPYA